jgi:membrane protease YdiL (CAAX protease family)
VLVAVGLLVFGTLYERTRDLAVPIVAHAVYNTLLLVLAFLAL